MRITICYNLGMFCKSLKIAFYLLKIKKYFENEKNANFKIRQEFWAKEKPFSLSYK